MDFRQVTTFLAIADELHFGRAAARLNLAQSSVSEQLQRRERSPGLYDAVAGTGIPLHVVHEVDDPNATALFVRTQRLVAFASAARATTSLPAGLVPVPIVDPVPTLSMHAVWPADHEPELVGAVLTSLDRAGPHH